MRSLDRHQVRVYRSHPEADDGGYMPATRAERLSWVWELTEDEWAFFGELMLNEATCLDARQACVRRQSWTAVTLWRLALLLGVAVALGGCVPMVEHYLRIEAPDGRYFNNTCHARLGPPSVVYYPYQGIFLSLDVTDWVSLGVHVPAGFSAQLDDDHVRISGITTGGSVDVSLRIIAAPQGDLGNRDPREFDGLPDPFSSPDHFGPLLGASKNGRYVWYFFVAGTDPGQDPVRLISPPAGLLRGTVELPAMTINGQHYGPQTLHFERQVHAELSPVNC